MMDRVGIGDVPKDSKRKIHIVNDTGSIYLDTSEILSIIEVALKYGTDKEHFIINCNKRFGINYVKC